MANQYTATSHITDTHKQCSSCNEIKVHSEFHKDKKNLRGKGLSYYCKDCANSKSRLWNKQNSHTVEYKQSKQNTYFKHKYKFTLEERTQLLRTQNNQCAICGINLNESGTHTHTDHDHFTGKVRGILCTNCNRGLGHFQDNKEFLMNAIRYLDTHTVDGLQKEGSCL